MKNKTISIMNCTEAFVNPGENHIIDMARANGTSWHNGETLEQMHKRYPNAIKVNFDQWHKEMIARNNTPVTWTEITEDKFEEMLGVLPPIYFGKGDFMVSEACDHHGENGEVRYQPYIARYGKFYTASRPMTRREFNEFGDSNKPFEVTKV